MSDFKTVYPGVYSPREQTILEETRAKLQAQIGKPTMFPVTPADPTLMKLYANAWDPWNPLFNDEAYGKNTKYGSIIAIPCWKEPGPCSPCCPWTSATSSSGPTTAAPLRCTPPSCPGTPSPRSVTT